MNDWEENYRDLGREMDAMERGAASMEREMDRLIQEVRDLKQENAVLKLEINRRLQLDPTETSRCPYDWCEDCKAHEQYIAYVTSNEE